MNDEPLTSIGDDDDDRTRYPDGRPTEAFGDGDGGSGPIPEFASSRTTYELLAELAVGGMGVICHARDIELQRDVALKLLRNDFRDNQTAIDRFLKETLIIARLQHPGVPPLYDCGVLDDGRPFYAMKLVAGQTLDRRMRTPGTALAGLLVHFGVVCNALDFAHNEGIVHLDVKPNNIMIGSFGETHLMDWGLSRRMDDEETPSLPAEHQDGVRGTPAYMSPEQANGERLDGRADVYSLGAVLCELLTGSPPHAGRSAKQLLRRAARGDLSAALRRLADCSHDSRLVRLAQRCLCPEPEGRPATAGEVADELQLYQESLHGAAATDMDRFFELSLDLFCIAGFDGVFRRINANFSRVLGYEERELLSQPFLNFVHERDREQTTNQMCVLSRGEPVVRFRNRYRAADGSYRTLEWTAKSPPGSSLIFAVARDVS